LIGILPVLFITGSAINVQSLLGFIFIVGIKVATLSHDSRFGRG